MKRDYYKVGMIAAMILVVGMGIASCIKLHKTTKPHERPKPPVDHFADISKKVDVDPLKAVNRQPTLYWITNVKLFMKALLAQENGPIENPWNITDDFLTDACEAGKWKKDSMNLSNSRHVGLLIYAYMLRYKAQNDQHAAAMFRKGPSGYVSKTGQDYGWRVQTTLWDYEDRGVIPLEQLGGVDAKSATTGCPMKAAIDANVKTETEWD